MASIDYETGFADENDQSNPDGWCRQGEYDPHWNDDYDEDNDVYYATTCMSADRFSFNGKSMFLAVQHVAKCKK